MATVDLEAKMTIKKLYENGCSKAQIAELLGVSEGRVRYHVKRLEAGAPDGCSDQVRFAAPYAEAIDYWHGSQGEGPINVAGLHAFLVAEQDYPGSLRSVQRYYPELIRPRSSGRGVGWRRHRARRARWTGRYFRRSTWAMR